MKYTAALISLAAVASAQEFTSIFNITATPDQVVNAASVATPGQPGSFGQFNYAINSNTNTICYDITLYNVSGNYQSPALTATHIHQADKGKAGPPRIAFPNPAGNGTVRKSSGCITGPFLTGIKAADNVTDTGAGFKLAQIEANPSNFFTDSHTNLFVAGVVRGQLDQSFKIIVPGSQITTATLTTTKSVTITSCPVTITDCPYVVSNFSLNIILADVSKAKPLTSVSVIIYTTVCPVSELPGYTSAITTIKSTTAAPAVTTPTLVATTTRPAVYTGAANSVKVGGAMMAAVGIAAALL